MLKIRVQGKPEQVREFMDILKKVPQISFIQESYNYDNRNSFSVRKYADVEINSEKMGLKK